MSKDFYPEEEILNPVDLCDSKGKLEKSSIGWSRQTLFNCNLSGSWLRKKKWNYWCVTNEECLFSVTISNIDYAGMVFAYFLDFKTNMFIEKTIMTPFGKGCSMPKTVHETVAFKNNKISVEFREEKIYTHIITKCDDFDGHTLEADFKVIYPKDHETLNVVVPWSNKKFQFTSKHECLPVEGTLKLSGTTYNFTPNTTFGCLDFGRGIWLYKVKWNWANASGIVNDKSVGFNLGGKWTDGTGSTENALVIDGKIIKLSEDIIFEYDDKDFMKPWSLKTAISNRVNLKFTPFYERIAKSNLLIIQSEVHQIIGHFSGTLETENGEVIVINSLLGCSEEHFGKW